MLLSHPERKRGTPATRTRRAVLAPDEALPELTGPVLQWPGRWVRLDGARIYVRETPTTANAAEPFATSGADVSSRSASQNSGPAPADAESGADASARERAGSSDALPDPSDHRAGATPRGASRSAGLRSGPAQGALYVHGLGGSSTNWTDLAALLAGHLDAAAIDLPGYGFSDPGKRYGVVTLASRVIRWIEQADRGPVHLLGNSLGGTVTVVVAATRPDLVRTLTLISPALPFLNPRRSLQSRMVPLLAVPGGTRLAKRLLATIPPERLARQVLEACFAEPGRLTEQRLAEAIEEIRLRYTTEHYVTAYLRTMRGLVASFLRAYLPGDGSLWRTAAAVRAPTLVIGGRQDRLVDVRVAPQTAYAIPDSRLLMLDGVGHVAQMEVPRLVARAVVALLTEVGAGVAGVTD